MDVERGDEQRVANKIYSEDQFVMISALQHLLFCPRQCALIHIEQQWTENRLTAEGRILHDRVHTSGNESRGKVRIEFNVPIQSLRLGLSGRADVVEFHLKGGGNWQPYPVEYKRGRPKKDGSDLVQLCAQAICIEEMLDCEVPEGALFYGKHRRRLSVVFDSTLQEKTTEKAHQLHELLSSGKTPQARYEKKCDSCSLLSICMPKVTGVRRNVQRYIDKAIGVEL